MTTGLQLVRAVIVEGFKAAGRMNTDQDLRL
jgi:hypothetical protein